MSSTYLCMHLWVCVCACVEYIHIHAQICTRISLESHRRLPCFYRRSKEVCLCAYVYIHTHIRTHTHTHAYRRNHTDAFLVSTGAAKTSPRTIRAEQGVHKDENRRKYMHTCVHVCIVMTMHDQGSKRGAQLCTHRERYIQTCIRTCIHTRTHTFADFTTHNLSSRRYV